MSKAFIFNTNLCVGCGACSAACVLENGWTVRPRNVYTYNPDAYTPLPVVNISLACSHCTKPVCLEGCPSGSYYREQITGAIIINDKRCLGCSYCQWNCPYDAPKFDASRQVIGKCNLCYSGLIEGNLPACVEACPTGALRYGENSGSGPAWFPDKMLNPSLQISGTADPKPLRIIPEISESYLESEDEQTSPKSDWSLILFSFLASISAALMGSSFIIGNYPDRVFFISLIAATGIISLFHLGIKTRAWRAITNMRTSPLSREIVLFILFCILSSAAVLSELPILLLSGSIAGIIMVLAIDNVYVYACRKKIVMFHSGQTFLSTLLMISFFTMSILPFVFIALIRTGMSVYSNFPGHGNGRYNYLRFIRYAVLLIITGGLISGYAVPDIITTIIFLTGELIDRVLFYADFKPDNIRYLMNNLSKPFTR